MSAIFEHRPGTGGGSGGLARPASGLFGIPKLTLALPRLPSGTSGEPGASQSTAPLPTDVRESWLGSLTSGMGLAKSRSRERLDSPGSSGGTLRIVCGSTDQRQSGCGILINNSSPSTPLATPLSASASPNLDSHTPHLQHSSSAPMSTHTPSHSLPSAPLTPRKTSFSPRNLSQPHPSTPRALSIRFAPLPDPRSRAVAGAKDGTPDVWWTREEKPDGTWGEYRLVVRRSDGQVIPVDELEPGSEERKRALERYHDQQAHTMAHPALPPPDDQCPNHALDGSGRRLDQLSENAEEDFGRLAPLGPSPSACSTPGGSVVSLLSAARPTLSRTTSCESTASLGSSGLSGGETHRREGSGSSLMKFIEAMRKPLRPSNRLRPTNSLPIDSDLMTMSGAPLCKTRSAESSLSLGKRLSGGLLKGNLAMRRTRSKDEESSQIQQHMCGLEAMDRPRRRSNYPPVAQRKVHIGGGRGGAGRVALGEEPAFVEWRPAAGAKAGGLQADEDDGSGMAWLRKRRREREERARHEEEERARAMAGASSQQSEPESKAGETQTAVVNPQASLEKADPGGRSGSSNSSTTDSEDLITNSSGVEGPAGEEGRFVSSASSSSSCHTGPKASAGTETESSSTSESKGEGDEDEGGADEEEDLDEAELMEEERLKALAMKESPFVRGASEVFRDREHHRVLKS